MQSILIFSENVHILCLSCNVKFLRQLSNLSTKSRNKRRYNRFLMAFSVKSALILLLLPLLTIVQHEPGSTKTKH